MKSSGIVLAVVMTLVAVGVYFGLQTFVPRNEPEQPAAVSTPAEPATASPAQAEAPPPAPEPVAEPAPAPAPAEEVAVAEPTPAPAPVKKARKQASEATARYETRKAPPAPDSIAPWWPDPAQMPRSQLKLVYAGQTQGERAIALLFSEKLDPDSLPKNVSVLDDNGASVAGSWSLGKNERLAYFKVSAAGRYTLVLQPTLTDVTQHMLGTPLQGPVYIQ